MLAVQAGTGVNSSFRVSLVVCAGMSLYGAIALFIHRSCGVVRREGGGGSAEPRARLCIAGQSVQLEASGTLQYLEEASHNEFSEYEFVCKRTIVPSKEMET